MAPKVLAMAVVRPDGHRGLLRQHCTAVFPASLSVLIVLHLLRHRSRRFRRRNARCAKRNVTTTTGQSCFPRLQNSNSSIHPPVHPQFDPSIYPCIRRSIYRFTRKSIHIFLYSSIHLYLSLSLSLPLSLLLFLHVGAYTHTHTYIYIYSYVFSFALI